MNRFAKFTTWIANQLSVRSIDWAKLAADGRPGVHSTQYITEYLSPAFVQATVTMASLDLQPGTTTQVLSDYANIRERFGDTADDVLNVVGTTVQLTNPLLATTAAWSAIRNVLWYLWSVTVVGVNSQLAGMIHRSGIPDADIAYHASLCTMSCNLLSQLDKVGALKPFKKGATPTNGLGAVPVGIAIAIGIAFVIALAWMTISLYETYRINNQVDAACNKALQSGDPKDQAFCRQLREETKSTPNPGDAVNSLLEKVSIAAMVGAGIWMLVQFGPGIATKIKQSVSAWKTA